MNRTRTQRAAQTVMRQLGMASRPGDAFTDEQVKAAERVRDALSEGIHE